jgi:2-oxoisovalerate dehydrogenase E1 component beta subunit
MAADNTTIVLGEDVGYAGGVFKTTAGLQAKHGPERVIDAPLSESGILGAAVGMAVYGMRPIAEIQFLDFIYPGFDQIVNEAAKFRYRSGGQYPCPLTIRTPYGGGIHGGHYHSQSSEAYFCHTAGLKVVIPSNPRDAKGLLHASIDDNDPVMYLEPKLLYRSAVGEVPEEKFKIALGEACVAEPTNPDAIEIGPPPKFVDTKSVPFDPDKPADVTVFAYGAMVHVGLLGAAQAKREHNLDIEVIDIRSLVPLDKKTILAAAKKTGRVVILQEAPKFCSYGSELSAIIAEEAIEYLQAPIVRVAGWNTPFPYALEKLYMPNAGRLVRGITTAATF